MHGPLRSYVIAVGVAAVVAYIATQVFGDHFAITLAIIVMGFALFGLLEHRRK